MLKNRYVFKVLQVEANLLFLTIGDTFSRYGATKDTELQLPLAVLEPFHKRLAGALIFPTNKMKVSIRKTEALAFHNLYMSGIIASNFTTQQINTEIHKTL